MSLYWSVLVCFSDLDEKYNRKRDRYSGGGGMIQDFKEKDSYKPEVKLEYVDDSGHLLNRKEAFRQLSHRFHGKGSGKKKTEKRSKKQQEEQVIFSSPRRS
jgi:U4/U6.U5 tri-snRNP-associated protein 1